MKTVKKKKLTAKRSLTRIKTAVSEDLCEENENLWYSKIPPGHNRSKQGLDDYDSGDKNDQEIHILPSQAKLESSLNSQVVHLLSSVQASSHIYKAIDYNATIYALGKHSLQSYRSQPE